MKNRRTGDPRRLSVIAAAVAACFSSHLAFANPTGPTVANGQVTFHQQGNLLQITNSPNAIINWQSFSIGPSEITRFLQQSASSAVLNRVTTQNPSSILGMLQSNGRVFLINPNGILFGPGSQVDVAGLVASTLNLSDMDFLAGRLRFTEVPGAGSLINQGAINAASGGQVYLVGPAVKNEGVITSPNGEVILAAGSSVELVSPGTPDLRVEITAPDNEAVNLGQIAADAGRVGIYAGLITQSGTVQANTAQVTEDGRIVLKATRGVNLETGSMTAASGAKGGTVHVETETGTIRVAGQIDATGIAAGGSIELAVTGDTGGIDLGSGLNAGNASVTVSGPGHTTVLNADIVTAGAEITINDSVELGAVPSVTLDTTGGGAVAGGANINITGAVDDDTQGSTGLVLNAGTVGTNAIGGAIGEAVPIASLTTDGSATFLSGGVVNTTGDQTYNGPVTLTMPSSLSTGSGGTISVNQSLSSGGNSLTVSAENVVIGGFVTSGPQWITTSGDVTVAAGSGPSVLSASGPQMINAGGGLIVQSSPFGEAQLSAFGGQTIAANHVEVTAQGSAAFIANFGNGDQTITTHGANAQGEGISVRSQGGFALIDQDAFGFAQSITANNADYVRVIGESGPARIESSFGGGAQTLALQGTGLNALEVGSASAANESRIAGGNQTITAGLPGQQGSITVQGGTDGSNASIGNFMGSQFVGTSATVNVLGGTSAGFSGAFISNDDGGGTQTVTADSLVLRAGESGNGNSVLITSSGAQQLNIGAGGIELLGGADGSDNSAQLLSFGVGGQQINTSNMTVQGGAGGFFNGAFVTTFNGPQQINVGAGGLAVTGGAGFSNISDIRQRNGGSDQSITVTGGGALSLQGGPGGEGNFARIRNDGFNQSIDFTSGGALTLTGGSGLSGNFAQITANDGSQSITGDPTITLTGGTGGLPDDGNRVQIRAQFGMQTIHAAEMSLTGGASGVSNGANIQGLQQDIQVVGDLTLVGQGSASGSTQGGSARLGGPGGAALAPTNLTLDVGGNVTLQGGDVATAFIGSSTLGGTAPNNIAMTVGGDVTLNPGAGTSARIGASGGSPTGGNISVDAGGNIALNSMNGIGTAIRTLDNVTLTANTISQGENSLIQANQLTVSAGNVAIGGVVTSGAQSITTSGDVTVAASAGPALLSASGPQTINAGGRLVVQSSPQGSAQVSAQGGQTINAAFIEVTAQGNNSASISNGISGDQVITVAGGGASPGIDVQSLASGGGASIGNFSEGAAQTITVTDADHINVNGFGPNSVNVSASIEASTGTQTISITGSGANAINVGSPGALGGSVINARSQNITAGAIGESGSITIVGPDVDAAPAFISTQGGFPGAQTVSTSGALTVTGGNAAQAFSSGLGHNASGPQTVTAASITLQGGSSGRGNGAEIRSATGDQVITVTGGGALALQGGGGTDNFARIRTNTGNQQISVAGGAIVITGGDGPDVPFPTDTANNFARIESRAPAGVQTVIADSIAMTGGAAGENNFAGLQAANQFITTSGDVTLQGGAAAGSGARLGGASDVTATNAVLTVGGNLTLTGGAGAGATIGSNQDGGLTTDVMVNVVGDIALNPGLGAGARIGSPSTNVAGGNISLTSTGGNIALNSANGVSTVIRTLDNVVLEANAISQGADSAIVAESLSSHTGNGTMLVGANRLANYHATNSAAGSLALVNSSPLLTVDGISQVATEPLIIDQSGTPGDLVLKGLVTSGPQNISATGSITVMPASPAIVQAFGVQTITAGQSLIVQGKSGESGSYAQITSTGAQNIKAGELIVAGGEGDGNFAEMSAPEQSIEVTRNVSVQGGIGENAGARIGGLGGTSPTPTNLVLTAGGNIVVRGGNGTNATIGSPASNVLGGNIMVSSIGNTMLADGAQILTTGNVALGATGQGSMINQAPGSVIQADQLSITADGGVTLDGMNQVSLFTFPQDIALSRSGDFLISTPLKGGGNIFLSATGGITVSDTWVVADDSVTIKAASLDVIGSSSGALIYAGGDFSADIGGPLRVASNSTGHGIGGWAAIYADGKSTSTAKGDPHASMRAFGVGLLDRIAGHGSIDINAGSVSLEGGRNLGSFAAITGGPIQATTTGDFSLTGGRGLGAFSWVLSSQDIDLTVGGQLKLESGKGLLGSLSFARIQTVHPRNVIEVYFPNLSHGGYYVNGKDGAYRSGLSGFFSGPAPAKPGKRLITTYGR